MADQLNKDEFLAHIGYVREDIAEMKLLQKEANGRTSTLESRVSVLEDRSPGRVSAVVSAVVSGVTSGLAIFLSQKGQ